MLSVSRKRPLSASSSSARNKEGIRFPLIGPCYFYGIIMALFLHKYFTEIMTFMQFHFRIKNALILFIGKGKGRPRPPQYEVLRAGAGKFQRLPGGGKEKARRSGFIGK
jgi:hypothetical protein